MCWSVLRREFRLVNFRLLYPNSEDFVQSPWFGTLTVLLYRFIVAVFCLGTTIASGVYHRKNGPKWFIYLTNWSFFFITTYFICACTITALHYKKQWKMRKHIFQYRMDVETEEAPQQKEGEINNGCREGREQGDDDTFPTDGNFEATRATPMYWYHEALWVIYNIASAVALLVTLSYWTFISEKNPNALSVIVHGVNSILMVAETMLSSVPVRLFHVIYSMLYEIAYIVFTVIYWASGGTSSFGRSYIYPQTDYTGRPVFSAVSLICFFFIGLPFCQSVLFCFYRIRVWMKTKYSK